MLVILQYDTSKNRRIVWLRARSGKAAKAMTSMLITGGAGFIGSHFVRRMLRQGPAGLQVINLDLLTTGGNLENLEDVAGEPRYHFVKGDIRDKALVDGLFTRYAVDTVVHFAAESHVDRSIGQPELFLTTNTVGTQILLDAARRHWSIDPQALHCRAYRPGVKFLQVSTDEVYGALPAQGRFTETSPLAPNSPYSASKAAADLMVRAYRQTYGLPVNITRCSNNYGPCQHPEKLIPRMIRSAMAGRPLTVYGDGLQIRDWIHVSDHCSAIQAVLERGIPGQIYNIGGGNERTNLEIIRLILRELDRPESLIVHVRDRPGHDRRYAIDSSKLTRELGWAPACAFEQVIRETIRWYRDNRTWLDRIAPPDTP